MVAKIKRDGIKTLGIIFFAFIVAFMFAGHIDTKESMAKDKKHSLQEGVLSFSSESEYLNAKYNPLLQDFRNPQSGSETVNIQDIMLLRSGGGVSSAAHCMLSESEDTSLKLVQYTGNGNSDVENIRDQDGKVVHKIPNNSLVRLVKTQNALDRYSYAEVIGTHQLDSANAEAIDTAKAKEEFEGYIFTESLIGIENHVIQVVEAQETLQKAVSASNTFWVPKESNDKFLTVDCRAEDPESRPIVFEVYDQTGVLRIGLVAVDPLDAEVFKSIKVRSLDETRVYFQRLAAAAKGNATGGGIIGGTVEGLDDSGSTSGGLINGLDDEGDGESSEEDEELEDDSYDGETGEGSNEYEDDSITLYDGNLEYIICTSQTKLNVRPYDDVSEVLFEANRHERVIPVESFNNDERFTKEVNGEEVAFVKVQFPDRDKRMGWVAESFVSEISRCVSYQQRLGDDQPIICTQNGGVNVRSENLEETLFQADQFEPVAIRSDAEDAAKDFNSGNNTYKMIPVNFLSKDSTEGWIAKDFIKTKKECSYYNQADAGGCCNFPLAQRPTHNYRTGMRQFGARRDKGKRLHAGVDLYSQDGTQIYSVDSGKVRDIYEFYYGTYAIEVTHNNFIVRYGELYPTPSKGVKRNATVRMGQSLGKIKQITQLRVKPMLHFEMYSTKRAGTLSGGGKYKRRSDLKNPTEDLRKWERKKFGTSY